MQIRRVSRSNDGIHSLLSSFVSIRAFRGTVLGVSIHRLPESSFVRIDCPLSVRFSFDQESFVFARCSREKLEALINLVVRAISFEKKKFVCLEENNLSSIDRRKVKKISRIKLLHRKAERLTRYFNFSTLGVRCQRVSRKRGISMCQGFVGDLNQRSCVIVAQPRVHLAISKRNFRNLSDRIAFTIVSAAWQFYVRCSLPRSHAGQ